MGIGGISDYNSMFANYRVPEIPSVDWEQAKETEALAASAQGTLNTDTQNTAPAQDIDLTIEEVLPARPGITDVNELSLTFNAGEDFGYIGKDSDIGALDMQKAISDMKKDQVLQQYQYFVGKSDDLFSLKASEDGLVFLKF